MSTATATAALDEAALRRPEFVVGIPLVLCDGQTWVFPKPIIDGYAFTRGTDGQTRIIPARIFGDQYDDLVETYLSSETVNDELVSLANLAFNLLERNYAITFAQARGLFRHVAANDPRKESNSAMWQAISDAATGREVDEKKVVPTSNGSASP